ncbi:DNA-binding transcriptional MocR family regulator [Hamadaea flava]|uniref:PLP-dependent aminotransferase family protein n=1 Tax=Hamadaea flava TaxID=1742688 RepID=A0ABV8LTQ1_9ACTN|nr:PLP-dependent aminotransferase family protein [Hamadaea flava]MCP2328003.1 DNA-binding transcriptional MocR family regulator [Hamadaea flava]
MSGLVRGGQLARLLGEWHALPARRRSPDYLALAGAVRGLLTDGRLALGVRLPAERELAEALGISRTTISAAYRELRDSGHLASRRGSGSWTTLPEGMRVGASGLWGPAPQAEAGIIDLSCAAPSAPPELVEAARAAVDDLPAYLGQVGYWPCGLDVLREVVADRYTARGLPTRPEQILITNGTQHALDLVIRLHVHPGAAVLTESPTYPGALAALAGARARIATYGLGHDGWDGELLLDTLRQTRPRLAYLVPEFQNPTGHLMPVKLREQLPAVAHSAGVDLVIDESFVDMHLFDDGATMPPPVAAFDRHSRVMTIGGLSKPYWGGMRIGWIRAAAPLVQRLAAVRVGVDMASPVLDQLVAVRLLAYGPEVVDARRPGLRARRDTLLKALAERLPEWRVSVPDGGLTLWAELDAPVSSALARAAESHGVRLAPGPRFGVDGTLERFLRLPFTLPEQDLVDAVDRIAAARFDLDRAPDRVIYAAEQALIA